MREKKTGLVLEGGGMRGIYTAGVLDVFMENGITFDGVIGVSAGARDPWMFLCIRTERQKYPVLHEVLPQLAVYELSQPSFNW